MVGSDIVDGLPAWPPPGSEPPFLPVLRQSHPQRALPELAGAPTSAPGQTAEPRANVDGFPVQFVDIQLGQTNLNC